MASCMSKLANVPASTLRGAIVATLARVTNASDEVIMDGVLFETSGKHDNWSGEHGGVDLHIRGECFGRRSCRGYDAGLGGGHEQVQWLVSADAIQR